MFCLGADSLLFLQNAIFRENSPGFSLILKKLTSIKRKELDTGLILALKAVRTPDFLSKNDFQENPENYQQNHSCKQNGYYDRCFDCYDRKELKRAACAARCRFYAHGVRDGLLCHLRRLRKVCGTVGHSFTEQLALPVLHPVACFAHRRSFPS